jgi:hypothetical protein
MVLNPWIELHDQLKRIAKRKGKCMNGIQHIRRLHPLALCWAMVALSLLGGEALAGVSHQKEYQVKAAFLFNFANFVQWPPEVFHDAAEPFHICVLGEDPFGAELDQIIAGENAQNRVIALLRLEDSAQAGDCQILFISESKSSQQPYILQQLHGQPILTVGENQNFIGMGGMIEFFTVNSRIRLAISPQNIKNSRLEISANLLQVAVIK